jgi:acetyltransferase-like isoleucine patch superfamily enzyme
MTAQSTQTSWRATIKSGNQWWARLLRNTYYQIRYFNFPTIAPLHKPLLKIHLLTLSFVRQVLQVMYFTPLFKSQLTGSPKQLQLYSGMPQVMGSLSMRVGERCRISGRSSFFGRAANGEKAMCSIGDNVDIGWQNTLAVGRQIIIEDNVRIAGCCYLAGFPGHPEDPVARAKGLPELDVQVGDIILRKNVWLASGVTVLAGVTIGENTIVGAGSVVTHDLPANIVAAGVPARVIRPINCNKNN